MNIMLIKISILIIQKILNFRDGIKYNKNTTLSYRTPTPQGGDIILTNDYEFIWISLIIYIF